MNFVSYLSEDVAIIVSATSADEAKSKLEKAILAIMADPAVPDSRAPRTWPNCFT
jgi:hypothetical protein